MNESSVGVIGMGIMGEPMTRNLMRAGFSVSVHSRTKTKAEKLLEEGATWCDSPAALACSCDFVISIVTDSPDVEQVYLGKDGVCEVLKPEALCIDMSTISPQVARQVGEVLEAKGGSLLDAPVSGGANGAVAGTLSIMVGGAEVDVERARPLFEAMGKSIVHCGPLGTGQLTKLCNQILCGLNLLGVCEAFVFGRQAGLELETMLNAVSKGAAGSWALENLGKRMIKRDFAPMFMIDLQNKDLRLVLEAARKSNVPLPGTALVHQLLAVNQAHSGGKDGTQALLKTMEGLAGISPE